MSLRDDLLNPIAGASPGGIDLLEDPIYLELREARREDDQLPRGAWETKRKAADFPLVIRLASETLARKSKDLWVAAWLSEALLRCEGFSGLSEGLKLLRDLLEAFWDHLYPELEDGDPELRAAPLAWVGLYLEGAVKSVPLTSGGHGLFDYQAARAMGYEEDVEGEPARKEARDEAVAEGKPTPEEFDQAFAATPKPFYKEVVAGLKRSRSALSSLEEYTEEKFGDFAPNFRPLKTALAEVQEVADDLLAKKLELEPDPPEAQPVEHDVSSATGESPTATLSLEPEDATDASARIASAAHFLQQLDPTNPGPYLLLRGFRWGELRAGGRELDPRLLSAPPTAVRTHLKSLLLDSKWSTLLEEGEKVMATPHGRGWLDLQRYVLTACYKLGSEYDQVAAAILGALRSLLRDLPQLPELTLMDDTPTANEETRAWLRDSGILQDAAEDEAPTPATHGPVRSALDRALVEVRAGRPQKGIELLMAEIEHEKSERARFLGRSEIAGIMVDAGYESVAVPILKELMQKIETHRLEEWEEGNLVARPLGLLYRCMAELGESEDSRRDLYLRICRLDPVLALNFKDRSGSSLTADSEADESDRPADTSVRVVDVAAEERPVDDGQA